MQNLHGILKKGDRRTNGWRLAGGEALHDCWLVALSGFGIHADATRLVTLGASTSFPWKHEEAQFEECFVEVASG